MKASQEVVMSYSTSNDYGTNSGYRIHLEEGLMKFSHLLKNFEERKYSNGRKHPRLRIDFENLKPNHENPHIQPSHSS